MKEPRALEEYRRAIVAACPELADATFAILASGWHSTAVEVGGRWVFKFPRGAEAEAALLREAAVLRLVRPAVSLPVPAPQVFAGPPLFSRHEKLPGGYLLGEDYRRLDEPARQAVGDALGRFYAELHRLPPARMRAVGALPVRPWESPAAMRRRALPLRLRPGANARNAWCGNMPSCLPIRWVRSSASSTAMAGTWHSIARPGG